MAYVDQLIGDNSAGKGPTGIVYEFRARPRPTAGVDVIHVLSPGAVIGERGTPDGEQVRRATKFSKSLKRRGIALVRTVSNDDAVVARAASRAEAILDDATTSFVALSPTIPAPAGRAAIVIGHSHLRDRFLGYPRKEAVPGRLLFVSPHTVPAVYEAPLKVFAYADLGDSTLRIVGQLPDALRASFDRTLTRYPNRITLRDEPLSDSARVEEVSLAELVVVAAPDASDSLGIIMLALSLDRPVLVEDTPGTRLLADEVGHDWVRLHSGRLTAVTLEAAVEALRDQPPTGRPDLDARDPNAIAAEYTAVFRAAAASS
ncbi:hypothetical protein MK786_13315 [Microbacterium sp. CFH 31415]|uniref:hypothetical protein n=1 Tax=Microbacterium sp. CFH 31415 TaxID=2921732 RepID=UPI001F13A8AE|nr:hypothetical protein [Microbacterium sp. CFH 31415]MCH6231725.1 hypothetical protein [Microbacterium sp. CFH 31415]